MPHLLLPRSPLVPGRSPVRIGYRDSDDGLEIGRPDVLVVLHGGWGAGIYSFDRQIAALDRHRVIVPDRTGYGASETIDVQPVDFHQRAAEETLAVLDALGLRRASFWGHSDGAVIAFKIALMAPDRVDPCRDSTREHCGPDGSIPQPAQRARGGRCGHGRGAALSRVTRF